MKHGETLNKVLFKKDLGLYKEININLDKINEEFAKVKENKVDIKKFFRDGKMLKTLIGVDIVDFLDLIKEKVKNDKVFYKEVENMIEDIIKWKNMAEKMAQAGLNYMKEKAKRESEAINES